MQAQSQAEKILRELDYDFASFDLDDFLRFVGRRNGCEIVPIPWEGMPLGIFGMWLRDRQEPLIYILYRCNVPLMHQVHIQLHEVAHFLLGHFAPDISQDLVYAIINGKVLPPFDKMTLLRADKKTPQDIDAETLTNLIQQKVVQQAGLSRLTVNLSTEERLANFLRGMRLE